MWTHQRSRDFRFWVWPWHSAARIAFPAPFGGRVRRRELPVPPLLGNRRDRSDDLGQLRSGYPDVWADDEAAMRSFSVW